MGRATVTTDTYMELIRRFRLRSIRSEAELDRANEVIHSLLGKDLDVGQREYLDALSDLVWLYEEKHHPIEDLAPHQMLGHLIEERRVSQRTVASATGIPVSTISELLSQKRAFTRSHIEKLAAYFSVNPAVFIQTEHAAQPRPQRRQSKK